MAKATVTGVDTYRWEADGDILSADRGCEIEVSDAELERGIEIGALEKASAGRGKKPADDAAADTPPSE